MSRSIYSALYGVFYADGQGAVVFTLLFVVESGCGLRATLMDIQFNKFFWKDSLTVRTLHAVGLSVVDGCAARGLLPMIHVYYP